MTSVSLLLFAVLGTLLASVLACVPGFHIYSVAGLMVAFLMQSGDAPQPRSVAMLMLGMVVGYAVVNAIPAMLMSVPGEDTVWMVLPGQRYLLHRRGHEALMLAGLGSLGGIVVLVLLAPFVAPVLDPVRRLLQPHLHWCVGLIVLYVLASEWPKGVGSGATVLARLWDGWRSLLAGLLVFLLSGLLGLVLAFHPLIPMNSSVGSLTPAFVGLFGLPWMLHNVLSKVRVPRQHISRSVDATPALLARAIAAGSFGGLLAVIFPAITVGIGGLIAGHAAAERDERAFIVSQGAAKVVYYVGAFLLFFAPGLRMTRGGMCWLISTFYVPYAPSEYWITVCAVALCGALASVLLVVFARWVVWVVNRVSYRWISWGTLALLLALTAATTGIGGVGVALVATAIGLVPIVTHCRRLNCMGVLLVPLLLDMAGLKLPVAKWLQLV